MAYQAAFKPVRVNVSGMNIIIDAYNIIKQIFTKSRITDKERSWFLARLADYAQKKKHTVYLVFDAGPYERPTVEKRGAVIRVYSGRHTSADEVIKHYIEEQVLKPMLIVTTDRQINAFAARHKVPSIDSLDFYKLMNEEKGVERVHGLQKAPGEAHKLHENESSLELDQLMQEASQVLYYKEEEGGEQKGSKQKAPKEERQMLKVLKKL